MTFTTTIVQPLDDLHRVSIPRSFCEACDIRIGDPLEVFVANPDGDKPVLCMTKYVPSFNNSFARLKADIIKRIEDVSKDTSGTALCTAIEDIKTSLQNFEQLWKN